MERDDPLRIVMERVSKRNPGALDVCFRLLNDLQELALFDFEVCLCEQITGEDLYLLFDRCCGRDIELVHSALMDGSAKQKVAHWWKVEKENLV